ncbi:MAG TPA: tetratricopeptide repeat protein [bacterium]|nr:tetratricopeptide repeat protein [bacterium]
MAPHSDDLNTRIEQLESQLDRDPAPGIFAPLVEAYRLSGRLENALETARRGLDAHPGHLAIRVVLARAVADSEGGPAAADAYREVLERDPGNLEARAFIDSTVRTVRSPLQAEGEHEAGGGVTAVPGEGEAPEPGPRAGSLSQELAHLADLFVPSQPGSDRQSLEPASIATLTLAEIYSRQGLHGKAAEVCERILEREPDNERAREALEDYRKHPASV